jgi:hypothetical protein
MNESANRLREKKRKEKINEKMRNPNRIREGTENQGYTLWTL